MKTVSIHIGAGEYREGTVIKNLAGNRYLVEVGDYPTDAGPMNYRFECVEKDNKFEIVCVKTRT